MSLLDIRFEGIRNLKKNELELSPTLNVVFGPNASGKTSLLEAIHLLGTARSFRTTHVDEIVQTGGEFLQVVGGVNRDLRNIKVGVHRQKRQTRLRIGGESATRSSHLAQLLPVQTLTPSSHELLEMGPKFRRRFLDWGVFHVKPKFHQIWMDYYRSLRQRNAALRSGATVSLIRQWEHGLISTGEQLNKVRQSYLSDFQPILSDYVKNLLGITVEIALQSGWKSEYSLQDALMQGIDSDRRRGFTQSGPHRADLIFKVDEVPVQRRFSRGQQKLFISALRLAQVDQLKIQRGNPGLLLVDDLAAELDQAHRKTLLSELQRTGAQIFVTVTEKELLDLSVWSQARVFHVKHGQIHEVV